MMAEELDEFEFEIDIKTKPRPIRIGEDKFYLVPEIMGPEFIGSFDKFDKVSKELTEKYEEKIGPEVSKNLFADEDAWKKEVAKRISRNSDYLTEIRDLMKTLISKFMIDDSSKLFLEKTYPDRVYSNLVNKLISVYTARPTMSATESGGQ